MSAWSQAVWIVKQLQANFDFSKEIAEYVNNLNALNVRINALNDEVQTTKRDLLSRNLVIASPNRPQGSIEKDTIWFKTTE